MGRVAFILHKQYYIYFYICPPFQKKMVSMTWQFCLCTQLSECQAISKPRNRTEPCYWLQYRTCTQSWPPTRVTSMVICMTYERFLRSCCYEPLETISKKRTDTIELAHRNDVWYNLYCEVCGNKQLRYQCEYLVDYSKWVYISVKLSLHRRIQGGRAQAAPPPPRLFAKHLSNWPWILMWSARRPLFPLILDPPLL
jgi:hypothetical protein